MKAMQAVGFTGYQDLKLTEVDKPTVSKGKLLIRVTAAGVTPLDNTILSGHFPMATAPLVLGNEGAGVVEQGGDSDFPNGSRVMFTGPYGVFESGSYSEWIAVDKEHLCLIPDNIDDVTAAGIPVAYLTAYIALKVAGFVSGKSVLAPAIGGSVGNAATQLAIALGAKYAISSTTSNLKAAQAKELGFADVIDLSSEGLAEGIARLTNGYGTDIIIDAIGGEILSSAISTLTPGGTLITLGYAAGRLSNIDLTNLIWKESSIKGFLLFSHSYEEKTEAWTVITSLLKSGRIKPIVAKTFPLKDAAAALQYQAENRPLGRVILSV